MVAVASQWAKCRGVLFSEALHGVPSGGKTGRRQSFAKRIADVTEGSAKRGVVWDTSGRGEVGRRQDHPVLFYVSSHYRCVEGSAGARLEVRRVLRSALGGRRG